MRTRLIVAGALSSAAAAAATVLVLASTAAHATTQDNSGLPAPKVELSHQIGEAFEGRFFLERAPRAAKVLGAQLDITELQETLPAFYFGELALRAYGKSGHLETQYLDLWWWYYHKRENRLTARVIPPGTVSPQKEEGETVGQISFEVPGGQTGITNHGHELVQLKNAKLTLTGRGTYPLTFKRTTDDAVDTLKIPNAELYGP